MESILITGGAGFIGSKLASKINNTHHVIILDKDKPSHNFYSEFHQINLCDLDELLKVKFEKEPTLIFHAAAQSGGYYSLKHPEIDFNWNVLGTFNLVAAAREWGVRKIVYTSSMAVYGNREKAKETDMPTPISFYGTSKLSAEYYVKLLNIHSDIKWTILRLFATYGSGQNLENRHQGILSIYLAQALEGDTIKITGAKDRIRELIHVDDVINASEKALFDPDTDGQTYNVSNGIPLSPEKIISEIAKQMNKNLTIKVIDGYAGDQVMITSDTTNIKTIVNSFRSLADGISEFLNGIDYE